MSFLKKPEGERPRIKSVLHFTDLQAEPQPPKLPSRGRLRGAVTDMDDLSRQLDSWVGLGHIDNERMCSFIDALSSLCGYYDDVVENMHLTYEHEPAELVVYNIEDESVTVEQQRKLEQYNKDRKAWDAAVVKAREHNESIADRLELWYQWDEQGKMLRNGLSVARHMGFDNEVTAKIQSRLIEYGHEE
jgi:hypothetical protein